MFSLLTRRSAPRRLSSDPRRAASSRGRKSRSLRRLCHEPLEDRRLLSTTDLLLQTLLNPTGASVGVDGWPVAALGDNVLMGAPFDNGGAVYLFDGAMGALSHTFHSPAPAGGGSFGKAIAAEGNRVLIGAPYDNTAGTEAGAAYLFELDGATGEWNAVHTFLNPTPAGNDLFGWDCALAGNRVVIGAYLDDARAANAGAAYLFQLDDSSGQWELQHTLPNPTPDADDRFGRPVAISGDFVLVGASYDDLGATDAGAAYLFDASSGALLETFADPQPVADGNFGSAVAAQGDTVFIGAPGDWYSRVPQREVTYAFQRDPGGTTWNLARTFASPTPGQDSYFGGALAVAGGNLLIGAPSDDTGAGGAGAAYLFDGATGGLLRSYLNPHPTDSLRDMFGYSVASTASGNVVIGSRFDDEGTVDSGATFLMAGFDANSGDIAGRVFLDLDQDGIDDDAATLDGLVVDLYQVVDGQTGELLLSAAARPRDGNYGFYGLPAGEYLVALRDAAGCTPTTGPQTVTVSPGGLAGGVDFGAYTPSAIGAFRCQSGQTIRDNAILTSQLTINDSAPILDLNVQLDLTHSSLSDLRVVLVAPNGREAVLLYVRDLSGSGQAQPVLDQEAATPITAGSTPYAGVYRCISQDATLDDFDLQDMRGTWELRVTDSVKNRLAGTLNWWSLVVTRAVTPPQPGPPSIESLSDSPDPVKQGGTLTLSANRVSDDQAVESVAFYRDQNGNGILETGSDVWLGTDTDGSNGWGLSVPIGSKLPTDIYTYFAQATDNAGLLSNVVSTTNLVKSSKPSGLAAGSLLAAASVVAPLQPMAISQVRSDGAPAAVDAVIGSDDLGQDLMNFLVDDRFLPGSPKRRGGISAVDRALSEIMAMPVGGASADGPIAAFV